ncbi:MAG: DUF4198 domain-containing protein [Thermodesulfobacteriota bacterium]
MKKIALSVLSGFMLLCLAASVQAHMLSLTPGSDAVSVGETVRVEVGFGHEYPHGKMEKEGRLKSVYAVAPDGTEIDGKSLSPSEYTFTPKQKGIYWVYAVMKPGFVSNTTQGRKQGNKQTLEGVLSCFAYRISAVTAVRCGKPSDYTVSNGARALEIFPADDPAGKGEGDTIALKVLFQGKPLAEAPVTPASAAHDHGHGHGHGDGHGGHGHNKPVKTDSDGIARIDLTSGGAWLFTAKHKTPYPDRDKCDSYSYITSLTMDFQ